MIMEPEGFAFAFDITSDNFVLNVNPSSKSPSNCNTYNKTSVQSKSSSLSLGSNKTVLRKCNLDMKELKSGWRRLRMSCMMEERRKVFDSPKREEAIQLLVILPLPRSPFFFRKFLYFTAKL